MARAASRRRDGSSRRRQPPPHADATVCARARAAARAAIREGALIVAGTSELAADVVHVWHTQLTASPVEYAGIEQLLSPAEHERADRFHRPRDRERYVIGRGRLRRLLAG